MDSHLQRTLRNLCFKTEWKYAIFWKLIPGVRTMLILEGAYYDHNELPDPSENMCSRDTLMSMNDGYHLQDLIELALAKMSHLVYSLGEGIIGQVALTGKHHWIFSDIYASSSWLSSEYCDGWQIQFAAGIRTIAAVAVVPHGVIQLGSLNIVNEDLKLVNHIKDVFSSLQNFSMEFVSNQMQNIKMITLCPSEVSAKSSDLGIVNQWLDRVDKDKSNRSPDFQSNHLPSIGRHNNFHHVVVPLPDLNGNKEVNTVEHIEVESPTLSSDERAQFLYARSRIFSLENQKEIHMQLLECKKCREGTNCWKDFVCQIEKDAPELQNLLKENAIINTMNPLTKYGEDCPFLHPNLFNPASSYTEMCIGVYLQNEGLHFPGPSEGLEQNTDFRAEINCMDTDNNSLRLSTVCELDEALGPAFRREQWCSPRNEVEGEETGIPVQFQEGMGNSQFILENGSENLLEAVVANAWQGTDIVKIEFCKSEDSLGPTEKITELCSHIENTHNSGGLAESSHEKDSLCSLACTRNSTESTVVTTQRELSLTKFSKCSQKMERSVEQPKVNKNKAIHGQICRPRPRDRQLIQDRVKELRELVPNGPKCSIDTLLERTIKHILFLQSVTKHADKLRKCAQSKLQCKRMDLLGSYNHEYNSSCNLEVGIQIKTCPIIVENLNMNGQMLIEILCEENNHFLEIAAAIRSLGLTILKGLMEAHDEKTSACFVVENHCRDRVIEECIGWISCGHSCSCCN
ncbi:PREDICTED: transcription factor EMB1444-like isoform X2 [Nelumbo nucifera]|uniref:Transcription factor EMB1444-like isoform X2 n=1 Tax=Nelumbo nucifera TaxID=4432 RepID=A0A1U8Q519_NELNU|nr:PREDICTED: transcription factor EMB1444-like isoform X2 [Nelumbo nucifera]